MDKFGKVHTFLWHHKMIFLEWVYKIKYSVDIKEIKAYKDKYVGQRCFIIGMGPSLTVDDLNLLKDEHTFASNRIYKYFDKTDWRPEFYSVCDTKLFTSNEREIDGVDVTGQKFYPLDFLVNFGTKENISYYPRTMYCRKKRKFRDDASKGLSEGGTVTYFLMQLAVYMGFTEIYLIGVDFNYSITTDNRGNVVHHDGVKNYAFEDNAKLYVLPNLELNYRTYVTAEEYSKKKNGKVRFYNATRGGKLEVYERKNLDDVLKNK